MTSRTRIVTAVVALLAFAAVLALWMRPTPEVPAIFHHDEGALRFSYHVPTGDEGLYDLSKDPRMLRNLRAERPDDLARLRAALVKKIGVESLEELRHAHRDLIARLQALGYF